MDIQSVALDFELDGNIYVADYGGGRIVKVSPEGRVERVISSSSKERGGQIKPHGLIVRDGCIYIAERSQGVILVLSLDGEVLARWRPAQKAFDPLSIRFAGQCAVVANYSDGGIDLFSLAGGLMATLGYWEKLMEISCMSPTVSMIGRLGCS